MKVKCNFHGQRRPWHQTYLCLVAHRRLTLAVKMAPTFIDTSDVDVDTDRNNDGMHVGSDKIKYDVEETEYGKKSSGR
ncbi:hypothetical protein RRG08_012872 [Elysia crispata]|uniref:Uncharacterized protein n=1 Tax=Elysia crispata TaxID=231223 RepID=A0AAE1ATR2_9GAST|nr:hypothetical protein RRG08_012872 [Elysia crispata]